MKRGAPLARRARLSVRTRLVSHSTLRRTEISPVSSKRKAENRQRTEALRPLREAVVWCQRCGKTGVGLDAHELLSRARGGSITDVSNIVLLDRACHTWITEHPAEAEAAGWALASPFTVKEPTQ